MAHNLAQPRFLAIPEAIFIGTPWATRRLRRAIGSHMQMPTAMKNSPERLDAFLKGSRTRWRTRGLGEDGLSIERLDFTGAPIPVPHRRLMTPARQIYVLCDAARTTGENAGGEIALRALDRILALYNEDVDLSRGLAFSLSRRNHRGSSARRLCTCLYPLRAGRRPSACWQPASPPACGGNRSLHWRKANGPAL